MLEHVSRVKNIVSSGDQQAALAALDDIQNDNLGLNNWGAYVSMDSRWNEFKFNGADITVYLTIGCHITSAEDARTITKGQGASGVKWGPIRAEHS